MNALELVGKAYDFAINARNVELQGTILEIKRVLVERDEEVLALRKENAELRRARTVELLAKFDKSDCSYYLHQDDGTKDGPFCPRCKDADQKMIRTHDFKYGTGVRRECPECEMKVWLKNPEPRVRRQVSSSWVNARRG